MLRGLSDPQAFVRQLALQLLVMVLSLTVHECAHAFVAHRLGDDTAERQGRLSLSPATHIDPVGTLLIPAISLALGGFSFIGWARPTPVSPARFRRTVSMRGGMALVAAAGPVSNLLLAFAALALYAVLSRISGGAVLFTADGMHFSGLGILLAAMFQVNVGLMIFNFLPIPPLDGSRLLPRSMDSLQAAIAPFSFLILLLLINRETPRHYLFELPFRAAVAVLQTVLRTEVIPGVHL